MKSAPALLVVLSASSAQPAQLSYERTVRSNDRVGRRSVLDPVAEGQDLGGQPRDVAAARTISYSGAFFSDCPWPPCARETCDVAPKRSGHQQRHRLSDARVSGQTARAVTHAGDGEEAIGVARIVAKRVEDALVIEDRGTGRDESCSQRDIPLTGDALSDRPTYCRLQTRIESSDVR